jgi:CoA:oxalate CoA-transferase
MQLGALQGITVLDLTRVLAGPFCTMIMAELGARVIKIEAPPAGDDSRQFGPFLKKASAYFLSLNRGKESLMLNLKDPGDREVFQRLLKRADVLVENFRPGAMDRLGLGWEQLHARHPRLIYAALSGFGQTGPRAAQPAYDLVIQAMGGIMSLTGQPGAPPTRVGSSIGDITAGLYAAVGINAALYHRERTGQGMMVDVAMLDCQVAILENALARLAVEGEPPSPIGARHPSIAPFDVYRAPDGWLVICAGNDRLFAEMAKVLGRPELTEDRRFRDNQSRTQNQAHLKVEMEAALAAKPTAHWLAALQEAGVPCGPVNDVAQVMAEPQVTARNMLVSMPVAGGDKIKVAGNPIKLSAFADPPERPPAPELDAQREAILKELEP